ncbi:hypothetical protein cmbei_4003265 [Cryptosporidium meleagridis]
MEILKKELIFKIRFLTVAWAGFKILPFIIRRFND